jgi:outer membrane cobalamin receptor
MKKTLVRSGLLHSFFLVLLFSPMANAQVESLEDLMNTEIKVASPIASTVRRAPGVISVFDRAAIQASGATTLQEFISLVPGFHIGSDIAQTLGLGFRGIWGHEGKILVLIDDFEYNELAYSTFIMGDRFPLSLIEKIEIVRGPGSVVHGGNAELAVISITTVAQTGDTGLRFDISGGGMPRASFSRGTLALGIRSSRLITESGSSVESGIVAYGIQSTVSDKEYNSLAGETADLKNAALFAPRGAIAHVRWQDWRAKLAFEDIETKDVVNYGTPAEFGVPNRHRQFQIGLQRVFSFDAHILKLSGNFNQQTPWNSSDTSPLGSDAFYDKSYRRVDTALDGSFSNAVHSFSYGLKYRDDKGTVLSDAGDDSNRFFGNSNPSLELAQNWTSFYGEYQWQNDESSVVLGVRHEIPSRVPSSTVPRFAYTKTLGSTTTVKAMASAAYRSPAAETLSLNTDIAPERTQTFEVELSEAINSTSHFSLNLFSTLISSPIVYTNAASGGQVGDQYRNFDRTGSNGGELTYQWHSTNLRASTSLAYATSAGMSNISQYASNNENHLLAFPTVRATGFIQSVNGPLKVSMNAAWEGVRQGWAWNSSTASAEIRDFEPTLLLGLNTKYEFEKIPGFSVKGSITNILNQERSYILPYKGETSTLGPMPGPSREWSFGTEYVVSF